MDKLSHAPRESVFSSAPSNTDPEDEVKQLRFMLADLAEDVDVKLCAHITQRTQKLTGFKFSNWTDCPEIDCLVLGARLNLENAERFVEEFYHLHPALEKDSIAGLTPALVERVSIVLASNSQEFNLTWRGVGLFFSTLSLCDSSSASDDEFRGMVRVALAQSQKMSSETTTLEDRMDNYILATIPIVEKVLDAYLLGIEADNNFKNQSGDLSLALTGAAGHQESD